MRILYRYNNIPLTPCFGILYNWYAVDDSRELTSSADWVVPPHSDYENLRIYIDPIGAYNDNIAGDKLRKSGNTYWLDDRGSDFFGFDARGTGQRGPTGVFEQFRNQLSLWVSDDLIATTTYTPFMKSNLSVFYTGFTSFKKSGESVRLVKDATGLADGVTTTYVGNDSKTYNAVVINELYWTDQNLEETEYRNGDPIPYVSDPTSWSNLTTGALCLYDNNPDYACKTAPVILEVIKYGYLYNQHVVTDVREIANTGWHLSTSGDMALLDSYLGAWQTNGGRLKEIGTEYWTTPNTGATNEVGFNIRGSGHRATTTGAYEELNESGWFWRSNTTGSYKCEYDTAARSIPGVSGNNWGFPIRLIKDSTTLSHGEFGIYTGNDGKIYRTICIGTQEWLADNLAETEYRDNSSVPTVTNSAT